jgi:hypothetical protein
VDARWNAAGVACVRTVPATFPAGETAAYSLPVQPCQIEQPVNRWPGMPARVSRFRLTAPPRIARRPAIVSAGEVLA